MHKFESKGLCITLLVAVFWLSVHTASAQSTIATVPSTDVVSANNVYLEFDFISHYASHHDSGFQSYVPRVVVGVGHAVEVGANVLYRRFRRESTH